MRRFFLFLWSLCWALNVQSKPIELVFWHSMAGSLGKEVKSLAAEFNKSQAQFILKPVYKGDYIETLTSFAAAFRAKRAPALVQIFEVGTAIMLSPQGIIKPIDDIMLLSSLSLHKHDFIESIREFYSRNGKLMALPFNLSIPVLYYNKDLLLHLGYTDNQFPSTWKEMENLAQKIKKRGFNCSYTTAYPGWILIESFLALHGLPMIATNPLRAVFDSPQLLRHFKRLKRWQRLGYFKYGGRVSDATVLFTSGVCPLFSQSSGAYNSLSSLCPFHLGLASLPLDKRASSKRHANITGGAALWAVSGLSPEQYQGLALFFAFLTKPSTQKRWHEHTGYLPIGLSGIYGPVFQDSSNPILKLAKKELMNDLKQTTIKNKGPQNQIRSVIDEALEAMFAGLLSPKEALKESAERVNQLLLRFSRNTNSS